MGTEPFKYMNVGQVLKATAEKFPEREAIVSCGEGIRLTFAETLYKVWRKKLIEILCDWKLFFLFKADKLAAGFVSLGLTKGDRVAIWSPNYEFWYISMLAIARSGLVCVLSHINQTFQDALKVIYT